MFEIGIYGFADFNLFAFEDKQFLPLVPVMWWLFRAYSPFVWNKIFSKSFMQ